eukprot:gene10925-11008_t
MVTVAVVGSVHVLAWLIYIGYEMSLIQITVGLSTSAFHYIVFYLLNIGLFYFNAHVILDFAFFKTQRPYLVSCALIAVEIVDLADKYLAFKERNHVMEREQLKSIADKLELENKYISAENAYLQNQISPHLLFNSLNFIYNTIHRLSDRAGKGVMLLADIMRYSLVSSEDNRTVLLGKEVEQIEKLIELSHLRFEEELFIKFRKKGKLADIRVLPLILITLVENMIKHGDLGDATNPAYIGLEQKDNTLVFVTKNKKRAGSPYPKGGLGLKNIEKRLVNFYPDRFTLDIQDKDDDFSEYIDMTPGLELVGSSQNPLEALEVLTSKNAPDITFLDVDMRQLSGMELAGMVNLYTSVVFTTAFPEYALQAFENEAFDYLLKPIDYKRFAKCIQKAKRKIKKGSEADVVEQNDFFNIKSEIKGRMVKIRFDEVMFIEGAVNYIQIHTTEEKHMTYLTMREIERHLPAQLFARIHRSFIVNINFVKVTERAQLKLTNGESLTMGDHYKQKFLDFMDERLVKTDRST